MFRKLRKATIGITMTINVVVIIAMVVFGYGGHLNPEHHPRLAAMTLLFPAALVANTAMLAIWLVTCWKGTVIPLIGYLICFPPIRTYLPLNPQKDLPEGTIKVISWNIYLFALGDTVGHTHPSIQYLIDSDADIICLQEADHSTVRYQYDHILRPHYPYYHQYNHKKSGDNMVLFSRFPILSDELIPYHSDSNLSLAYVLDINGRKTLVVNNHLESNMLNRNERDGFTQMMKGKMQKDAARRESRNLLTKLGHAAQTRASQARTVADYIAKARREGMSVIVCGDFNDNPLSYAHHTICRDLTDCHTAAAFGPGFSFNRNRMFVRIDNIFCSDEWQPYNTTVDRSITTSDHYPIVCHLKYKAETND